MASGEITRIAVVTGSNKGIGFATVRAICKQFEGIVYLTARDEARGKAAVAALEGEGLKPHFHQLDIENEQSITALKDFLVNQHGGLDVLVNNAGFAFKVDSTVSFGEQAAVTVGINFRSTLKVCNILFPILRPHARVVNVSSLCGLPSKIPGKEVRDQFIRDDLTVEELDKLAQQFIDSAQAGTNQQDGWGGSTYVVSKVALSALTRIQHRQFLADSRPDLVINHVHPGYVDTDMSSHKGPLTIDEGAVAPTFCALLPPNVDKPKGDFVWYDKQIFDWTTFKG